MKKPRLLALAVFCAAGTAASAAAAPDRLGAVNIYPDIMTHVGFNDFGGGVDGLAFRATDGDVMCDSVTTTFGDGTQYMAYHGLLEAGRQVSVALPEGKTDVRRVDFVCEAQGTLSVGLEVAAEITNHRDEWRNNPNWSTKWSHMFDWAGAGDTAPGT